MRILFWTGYRFETFNGNSTSGLGGTETALIEISKRLASHGHEVHVAGEVNSSNGEKINGVTWHGLGEFEFNFLHQPSNYFDIAIGVNYLNFLNYLEDADLDPKYKWIWMHNTEYEPWYKGRLIEELEEFEHLNKIQCITTPSDWASAHIIENIIETKYPNLITNQVAGLWNLDNSKWRGGLMSIPNGINKEDFYDAPTVKDPNKFIWSSAVDRGLVALLDNWYKIKKIMPNATLDVYYPKYSDPNNSEHESWYNIDGVLDKLNDLKDSGVTDMGSVSKQELYSAAQKATYWLYLSDYEETFCITALEMQMNGVLCIVSDKAALPSVVRDGVIIPSTDYDAMFNMAVDVLANIDIELKNKALRNAKITASQRTWDEAGRAWHAHITNNADQYYKLKHQLFQVPIKPITNSFGLTGDWREERPGMWRNDANTWLRKPNENNEYLLVGWRMVGSELSKELIRENFPETVDLTKWSKSHIPLKDDVFNEFIDVNKTKVFLIISDPREVAINIENFENGLHMYSKDYVSNPDGIGAVEFINEIADKQIELIESYKKQFGENCIVLRYEDVLWNQGKFLSEVSEFLDLEPLGIDDARKYKWSIHKNVGNFHRFFSEEVLRAHYEQYKPFYDEWKYDYGGFQWLKYHWHTQNNTLERNINDDYKEMLKRNGITEDNPRTDDINEF